MRILIILIFAFFCLIENSFSQLPPCVAKSKQDYMSLTCNFKQFKSSPPLSLNMPEDVVRAYLYIDSISSLDELSYINYQNVLKQENYNSNFIKNIVKKTLLIKQFDEIRYFLFKYYFDTTSVGLFSTFGYLNEQKKIDSLINAYYLSSAILKVEFTDSIQRFNSKNEPDHTIWKGSIKEIVYGSYGPPCKEPIIPADVEHYEFNNPETRKLEIDDCIQINHIESDNPNFKLNTNKTYYLFTYLGSHCSNFDYTFGSFYIAYDFDVEKFKTTKYYLFEVDGDNVLDPQHIFSESGKLNSNQFKSTVLNELDQARKNGTIQRTLLSIEEHNETPFSIFPNPALNTISFKGINNPKSGSIINSIGIQVFNGDINPSTTIDLNSYPIGMYFLKLNNQNFKFEVIK